MTWTFLLLALPGQSAPQPVLAPELLRVEKALQNEKIGTDGPALLAYIRAQTPSPEDDARLRRLIVQLGDDDFDTRESASQRLIEAGPRAIPFLRPARKSNDREVVRRAALCLEALVESPLAGLMPGVVRLLGERRPAGTIPALLAYLPTAGDEAVEDVLFELLRTLGLKEGRLDPALLVGLTSSRMLVRAVAAHVAGDLQDPTTARRLLGSLLRDPEARVRFEAAQALVRNGEAAGIPALIDLVAEGPPALTELADAVLARLAGRAEAGILAPGSARPLERQASAAAWRRWWNQTASHAGWTVPRPLEPYLGQTILAEFDTANAAGAVSAIGRDGKKRWQITGLQGPTDVQPLPGGRLLVAERGRDRVSEYDHTGRLHWSHRTRHSPIACQRLADGTTMIVTFNDLLVVDPEGKARLTFPCSDGLRDGQVLPDGNLAVITAKGDIIEMSPQGKELRRVTATRYTDGAGYWASIDALAGGRYLASFGSAHKVVEMDRNGKIEREWNVSSPVSVTRLRNGHTLVVSFEGRFVVEIDREGKEVWKVTTTGRPFAAVRH